MNRKRRSFWNSYRSDRRVYVGCNHGSCDGQAFSPHYERDAQQAASPNKPVNPKPGDTNKPASSKPSTRTHAQQPRIKGRPHKALRTALSAMLAVALVLSLAACGMLPGGDTANSGAAGDGATAGDKGKTVAVAYDKPFAKFTPYLYDEQPDAPQTEVQAGLANVVNLNQFTDSSYYYSVAELSAQSTDLLQRYGFAVSDAQSWNEYFGVYEQNRYSYAPSFITTDSATHSFHLMFDHILTELENSYLTATLTTLSAQMASASAQQREQLKGTDFENAATRNLAYFSVGARLLDPSFAVAPEVADFVNQELALIEAAAGADASPIINLGAAPTAELPAETLDYSQFTPRSHYTKNEALRAYFKASKWYGQATLRSASEDEVRSALLICNALLGANNEALWHQIFEPINFFVGECDDITFYQYQTALANVLPEGLGNLQSLVDVDNFALVLEAIAPLAPPQINSLVVEETDPDVPSITTGFRFLGERFTIDASIFQQLIHRLTADRMLPKALDIPAAFGSERARAILEEEGEFSLYPEYEPNLQKVQEALAAVPETRWTSNLYWTWMYMLQPLADNDTDGLPSFMQSDAWLNKELNTFAGSWTELKHDTLLYAKQPMAERGGEGITPPPPPDDRGYVEPNPVLFGRLASLTQMTIDGLDQRGMLSDESRSSLEKLHSLAASFATISVKELAGEALSAEEYEIIRTYGAELEHIWTTAKADELAGSRMDVYLDTNPGGIVADVATDPSGQALEEATGYAKEIYVIFVRDGQPTLGRGTVYSHYEFTAPLSERLTDEAWHERMRANDLPSLASWQTLFTSDIGQSQYPHNDAYAD